MDPITAHNRQVCELRTEDGVTRCAAAFCERNIAISGSFHMYCLKCHFVTIVILRILAALSHGLRPIILSQREHVYNYITILSYNEFGSFCR